MALLVQEQCADAEERGGQFSKQASARLYAGVRRCSFLPHHFEQKPSEETKAFTRLRCIYRRREMSQSLIESPGPSPFVLLTVYGRITLRGVEAGIADGILGKRRPTAKSLLGCRTLTPRTFHSISRRYPPRSTPYTVCQSTE